MTEETTSHLAETIFAPEEMEIQGFDTATNGKRVREEEDEGISKKQKAEESVEKEDGARLGPKSFGSSKEMFDYFYKLLHYWPPNFDVNKYEQMVLVDLLKKGHLEPDKKFGAGIQAFQIRFHPLWKSRCFFLIREDETVDDFSFRKCVDHILPLPEEMKIKSDVNNVLGGSRGRRHGGGGGGGGRGREGGGGGGGGGGWRGRGRGGKSRY